MPEDHASFADPPIVRGAAAAPGEGSAAVRHIRVLLPLPLPSVLDYLVPEGVQPLEPGAFVRVPLGVRSLVGVVWEGAERELPVERLKPVAEVLPIPRLRPELCRFVARVAAYTMTPPGMVLRMTMSVAAALEAPRQRRVCGLSPAGLAALCGTVSEKRLTPARQQVLETLRNGMPLQPAELARAAGCGPAVIRTLVACGLVEERLAPTEAPLPSPADWRLSGPPLSPDQSIAARRLVDSVAAGGFSVTVLDGVTGSGKTETYFAAIAAALAAGRQALVLLPEIALGAQWLERFRERFGALPAQWHSDIREAERRDTWRAVITGRARVVVGARSALFLPFPELGLIVVDEEHDTSYKQEEGVIYQARDMAVLRASLAHIPIVLVSATPSLETVVNVARGRYQRVALPRRHASAELPTVRLVDMRRERIEAGRFLAPPLVAELAATFEAGEQALLFLKPARLCAPDFVPGLRSSLRMPELHGLAGRAPFYRAPSVPPLRPCRAGPRLLPGVPRGGSAGAVRTGCRTPSRRGDVPLSGGACGADGQRSVDRTARRGRARPGDDRAALRYADRDSNRRQGPSLSDADPGRRGRCRSRVDGR